MVLVPLHEVVQVKLDDSSAFEVLSFDCDELVVEWLSTCAD